MKLTTVQRAAVRYEGHALLIACPGSGKTRTIISKLLRCVPVVRGTARRIACITYTNAAVHEIEHRLRAHGAAGDEDLCEISTIHAFCLSNILRCFSWKLDDFDLGFTVLPPDSQKFTEIVDQIRDQFGLDSKAREAFQLLNRAPDGSPIVAAPLTPKMAMAFWEELRSQGYVDFPSIVYHAFRILNRWPSTAAALACRFPWVLVDEFQDTSETQTQILRLIARQRKTRFFLVGDPHQSIYGFAGARPDLMYSFAAEIGACQDFDLLDNFRSSAAIIEHADRLCPRKSQMVASGENADFPHEPQHVHTETAFQAIAEQFLPALLDHKIDVGQAAVLAPWWFKLFPLGRDLRELGIPIVGPGARPYKKDRLFSAIAEAVCGYLTNPSPKLVTVIERDLFILISQVTGSSRYGVFSYAGRRTVYALLRCGEEFREKHGGASAWLNSAAGAFSELLIADGWIGKEHDNALRESVADMHDDMAKNKVDVANLSVEDLGLFACPERSLKLMTMHASKGREFDAVAIIDLHDGRVPDYRRQTQEGIEDGRRLLYVAATRARKVLMYCTDSEHFRNAPSRFLGRAGLKLLDG